MRGLVQTALLGIDVIQRTLPGDRLDPAHAGRDTALGQDLEHADVAGAAHMGTAAQLGRGAAHAQHAHLGFVVGADLRVHLTLDGGQLGRGHRLEVREVEAQPVRCDQRALLHHVGAQHVTQGGVQQVGGGMVEHDRGAARGVDPSGQPVADRERTDAQGADVAVELAAEFERVAHIERAAAARQLTRVAHLAAALGVERGARQKHDRFLARLDPRQRTPFAQQPDHFQILRVHAVVAEEGARRQLRSQLGRHGGGVAKLARGTRGLALVRHRGLEAVHVHGHAALAGDVRGQVDRKTVGVIQTESVGARDHARGAAGHLVKDPHAGVQGLGKALLLGQQRAVDQLALGDQFRVGLAHRLDQRRQHGVEERLLLAQHPAVAQGPADDPAQHIAAALVGRQDAIDDQEAAGADVVGDDPQRLVVQIRRGGQARSGGDQVLERVDLVVAVLALQDRGQPFQAHAGIHARRGQRCQSAVGLAVELHEHQVPDLDETVAVLVGRSRRTTEVLLAVIVENLGTRPAGAGVGHLPEVVRGERRALVVADADDALHRHADLVAPDGVGLVIGLVDGHHQPRRVQSPDAGQQLPRPLDRVVLEVVAERPVAQHLEEGVVTRGVAHLVQIVVLAAGAQAALDVRGAHVAGFLAAQKHVLELDHPGVGEQQGRIVGRHQRRGRHDGVPALAEKREEIAADLVGAAEGKTGLGSVHGVGGRNHW